METNTEAAEIYTVSKGQVITRDMDGTVTDIDNRAVIAAMELRGVKDRWGCLLKVRSIFHHMLKED